VGRFEADIKSHSFKWPSWEPEENTDPIQRDHEIPKNNILRRQEQTFGIVSGGEDGRAMGKDGARPRQVALLIGIVDIDFLYNKME